VLLQAEGAGGPDMSFFLMMGVIFLIFYVLVMRPQQRQQKAREEAIKAATKGDKVVTNGGLHGVITAVGDDTVTVEIARVKGGLRVEVEVSRSGLASVLKPGAEKAEKSAEKGSDKKKEGGEGA
jgi:preprotein translocase subunit YajC